MSITRHLLVVELMAYTIRDLGLNIKTMLMVILGSSHCLLRSIPTSGVVARFFVTCSN